MRQPRTKVVVEDDKYKLTVVDERFNYEAMFNFLRAKIFRKYNIYTDEMLYKRTDVHRDIIIALGEFIEEYIIWETKNGKNN